MSWLFTNHITFSIYYIMYCRVMNSTMHFSCIRIWLRLFLMISSTTIKSPKLSFLIASAQSVRTYLIHQLILNLNIKLFSPSIMNQLAHNNELNYMLSCCLILFYSERSIHSYLRCSSSTMVSWHAHKLDRVWWICSTYVQSCYENFKDVLKEKKAEIKHSSTRKGIES